MTSKKTIKELKKEIKDIDKKIHGLKLEKKLIESKGCFSDQELNERDKKIKTINNETTYLNNEKKSILESIILMEGKKWIKKRGFQYQ